MRTPYSKVTCFVENGKYTIDGYDFFDTLDELETEIAWQKLWAEGKAKKENGKWVLC